MTAIARADQHVAADPVERAGRGLPADGSRAAEVVDQGLADVAVPGPRVAAQGELHGPPRQHDDRDPVGGLGEAAGPQNGVEHALQGVPDRTRAGGCPLSQVRITRCPWPSRS